MHLWIWGCGRTDAISNPVFEAFGRPNVGRCICIVGVWAGADAISNSVFEAFGRPNVRTEDRLSNLIFVHILTAISYIGQAL